MMLNGNTHQRVLMRLGCSGREEAFPEHIQPLVNPPTPLPSAALALTLRYDLQAGHCTLLLVTLIRSRGIT